MKKDKKTKKFALPRLLIIGCGDVGMRILPLLTHQPLSARFKIYATTSHASRCADLRAAGAIPVVADLDHPEKDVEVIVGFSQSLFEQKLGLTDADAGQMKMAA